MFALSNGHIGLRGNLDEGEPFGLPGTYLNGFYETRPLPYAEAGYGYPEDGQTVVNATNGKLIRLLVDDEPFDIRYGELLDHTRSLDLREGVLTPPRSLALAERPRDRGQLHPAGLVRAALAWPRSATRSGRSTASRCGSSPSPSWWPTSPTPSGPATRAPPPRWRRRWRPRSRRSTTCASCSCTAPSAAGCGWRRAWTTSSSKVDGLVAGAEAAADLGRVWLTVELQPGQRLRVHEVPRLRLVEPAFAAVGARPGRRRGVERQAHGLGDAARRSSASTWTTFWEHADVEIDGDGELQQAVRFALFHTLQAGARAERRAIPAKGLTGPGYDGHAFWDSETFVLPVLTYTQPAGRRGRAALAPRHARPRARARQDAGAQGRRVPVADDPRPGVQRVLARRAPRGSTSTPTSRTRSSATSGPPATRSSRPPPAWSCSCTPRGCGARSATTTTRAASTSTASPARTSTPRSPTTTSTRT